MMFIFMRLMNDIINMIGKITLAWC